MYEDVNKVDSTGSGHISVVRCHEHGNKPSASSKAWSLFIWSATTNSPRNLPVPRWEQTIPLNGKLIVWNGPQPFLAQSYQLQTHHMRQWISSAVATSSFNMNNLRSTYKFNTSLWTAYWYFIFPCSFYASRILNCKNTVRCSFWSPRNLFKNWYLIGTAYWFLHNWTMLDGQDTIVCFIAWNISLCSSSLLPGIQRKKMWLKGNIA